MWSCARQLGRAQVPCLDIMSKSCVLMNFGQAEQHILSFKTSFKTADLPAERGLLVQMMVFRVVDVPQGSVT